MYSEREMLTGFYIFHKKHPTGLEKLPASNASFYGFKTCLRHIFFAFDEGEKLDLSQDFEVFKNEKAYQFIAEVLCGLHSPVVGETEVFGQFKTFLQAEEYPYALKQIFSNLLTDVKKTRKLHLQDLGGQSYGSLIRKLLSSPSQVAIIGAGAFTADILPWIYKDENQVQVFARNAQKAKDSLQRYERVEVKNMNTEKVSSPVAIIAAPLTSVEIQKLIPNSETLVIDLRGESREDACTKFSNYKDLSGFFEQMQSNQSQILKAKALALQALDEISRKRFNTESPRPFGWEDICVW